MKAVLFGATGMIGQGVLRECLLDPEIDRVLVVTRNPTGETHDKLVELLHGDFFAYDDIADQLAGCDVCFFCLGISSAGMKEADYHRVTYELTLAAANTLAARNPNMTFIYVSGAGTDSSEQGRSMWARVKGKTENALLKLPFKAAYMFRPGAIQPKHGIKSKTKLYRALYVAAAPLFPLAKALFPNSVVTTEQVGRAMINVATHGADKRVLEPADISAAAQR